jgi:hypothetical protein
MHAKGLVKSVATVGAMVLVALGATVVHSSESSAFGMQPVKILTTGLTSGATCGPNSSGTRVAFTIPGGPGRLAATPVGGVEASATVEQDEAEKTFRVVNARSGPDVAYVSDVTGDNHGGRFPQWDGLTISQTGATPVLDVSALGNFRAFSLCLLSAPKLLTVTSTVDVGSEVFGYRLECTDTGGVPFMNADFSIITGGTSPASVELPVPLWVTCSVRSTSVPRGYVPDAAKLLGGFRLFPPGLVNTAVMRNQFGDFDLEVHTLVNAVTLGAQIFYTFAVTVTNRGTVGFVADGAVNDSDYFYVDITHPTRLIGPLPFVGHVVIMSPTLDRWQIPSIARGESLTFASNAEGFPAPTGYVPNIVVVCGTIPTGDLARQPREYNTANNSACAPVTP